MRLCVVVETAVIFSKSLTAHHSRDIVRDTHKHGMWREEGVRASIIDPHPISPWHNHTSVPQKSGQTPHACVSRRQRRTKKTCPSRSKERHSCQLVTCTSTRQASSSATSFQLPPSETKNTQPTRIGTNRCIRVLEIG